MDTFWKRYRAVWILAVIALLIPLFAASFFNRPSADDLSQPLAARLAILHGQGIGEALAAAAQGTADSYMHWSGIYFSMFLSRIPLMIFEYHLAWVHPVFFLLFLLFAVQALTRTAGRLFGVSPIVSACAGLMLYCMFVLFMPSVSEGIYWYSGAVNYTFMFSLSLLLFAGALSWCYPARDGTPQRAKLIFLCACFFLLGGANFTTSTVSVAVFTLLTLHVWRKRPHKRLIAVAYLCLLAGYCLAVFAPGNAVRQADFIPYTLAEAAFYTLRDTFSYLFTDLRVYLFLLFFLPVAMQAARQTRVKCRHPLAALLLSYLVVAAGFFPPIYSVRNMWIGRLINIQFFLVCLFYAFNITYMACYLRQTFLERYAAKPNTGFPDNRRRLAAFLLATAVLFGGSLLTEMELHPFRLNSDIPSVMAVSNLRGGQLREYASEYDALVARIAGHADEDFVSSYTFDNELLHNLGSADEYQVFAWFFGADSVTYAPETEP